MANADVLDQVRSIRQRLAVEGPRFTRSDGDFERVSIPAADGDVLRDLLIDEQAATVIEIGLAYGASALAIGEALAAHAANVRHVIIDAYQDHFGDAGWKFLVAAGIEDTCLLLREQSQFALPRLLQEDFVADAAFVDGSHIFHNVFVDLHFLRQLVRPGGLVILDDCNWESMATAVRYFEINTGWRREEVLGGSRLRAYRLPSRPVEPSFQDFNSFA